MSLLFFVQNNEVNLLEERLKYLKNKNEKYFPSRKLLRYSVLLCRVDCAKILIDYGAGCVLRDELKILCENRENFCKDCVFNLFFMLVQKYQGNFRLTNCGNTLLHLACKGFTHPGIIDCLLESGLCASTQNYLGQTSFHIASRYGQSYILKKLYQDYCNKNNNCYRRNIIDDLDIFEYTALLYASTNGHYSSVRVLLRYPIGADPNILYGCSTIIETIEKKYKKKNKTFLKIKKLLKQEMDSKENDEEEEKKDELDDEEEKKDELDDEEEHYSDDEERYSDNDDSDNDDQERYSDNDSNDSGDSGDSDDSGDSEHICRNCGEVYNLDRYYLENPQIKQSIECIMNKVVCWCQNGYICINSIMADIYYLLNKLVTWKERLLEDRFLLQDSCYNIDEYDKVINLFSDFISQTENLFNLSKTDTTTTILIYLCKVGDFIKVKHILDCSTELNVPLQLEHKDIEGCTALFYACINDSIEIVELLVECGAIFSYEESVYKKFSTRIREYLNTKRIKDGILSINEIVNEKIITIPFEPPYILHEIDDYNRLVYDIILMEEISINSFLLLDQENVIIVFKGEYYCYNLTLMRNINESLYLDCKRDSNGNYILVKGKNVGTFPFYPCVPRPFNQIFLKLSLQLGQIYVYLDQFVHGFLYGARIFHIEEKPSLFLQYTTSYNMVFGMNKHHGQEGTDKVIYNISKYSK